jgi:acyl-CoA reductase-like NAD-dependent aldehyde dehydrogenase
VIKRKVIRSINPATEEVINEYPLATEEEAQDIIRKSEEGFRLWGKKMQIAERTQFLLKISEELLRRKEELATLATTEMGKTIREARAEVEKCSWLCKYYAENGVKFLEDEIVKTDAKKSFIVFQPLGTILAIMPWNFPYWQALRFAIPALTVGNVVILKHSSYVPACALAIEEVMTSCGLPDGVFRTIIADSSLAKTMINSKKISAVSLTGSVEAGSSVGEQAGRNIKNFVLELGGSDAFVVLDDADTEIASRGAVQGRLVNSGESCIAAKRFIVMKSVAKEFTEKFADKMNKLRVGNPMEEDTNVGPLVREDQRRSIEDQVKDSVKMGGKVVAGGGRPRDLKRGYYYLPTIITNVTKEMPVISQETFGPVAPVIEVETEEEAIQVANDSDFGLGSSVWTSNLERGERVARQFETGLAFVNNFVKSDPRMPFGGVKRSGIGRELSRYGLLEFVNIKSLMIY